MIGFLVWGARLALASEIRRLVHEPIYTWISDHRQHWIEGPYPRRVGIALDDAALELRAQLIERGTALSGVIAGCGCDADSGTVCKARPCACPCHGWIAVYRARSRSPVDLGEDDGEPGAADDGPLLAGDGDGLGAGLEVHEDVHVSAGVESSADADAGRHGDVPEELRPPAPPAEPEDQGDGAADDERGEDHATEGSHAQATVHRHPTEPKEDDR